MKKNNSNDNLFAGISHQSNNLNWNLETEKYWNGINITAVLVIYFQ